MSGDEKWMFPSIGPIEAAGSALDMARLSLTQRHPAGEVDGEDRDELTELEGIVIALSNLSAVLLLLIQGRTAQDGRRLDGVELLELIRTHEQARADLDALDDRPPFDA